MTSKIFKLLFFVLISTGVAAAVFFVTNNMQSKNSNADAAIEFNNFIVEEQLAVVNEFQKFGNDLESNNLTEGQVSSAHEALLQRTQIARTNIENVEVMEGGEEYKAAAVDLMDFYVDILDDDYRRLLELAYDPSVNLESLDEIEVILSSIESEEKIFDAKIRTEQEEFAEIHDMEIL